MEGLLNKETPGFARIDVPSDDPFILFNKWYEEAKQSDLVMPETFTLATVGRDGKPSARGLLMRRLDADGFVFTTQSGSRKTLELAEVPSGAMVFLWAYRKNGDLISHQIRIEGSVRKITPEESRAVYDNEPLFSKLRSHVCSQGSKAEWQDLQDSYINLLGKVKEGHTLAMPDQYAGYKLTADVMDFYLVENNTIADRFLYEKNSEGKWTKCRIAA